MGAKGGSVCIGGGLPEVLTAMELKSIISRCQNKKIHSDIELALVPLLLDMVDALLLYPVLVNTANGMSWTQANLRNDSIVQTIYDHIKYHNWDESHDYVSIVQYLEGHSTTCKNANESENIVHTISRPIYIPNDDIYDVEIKKSNNSSTSQETLDCLLIKVESLRSAISFVASTV